MKKIYTCIALSVIAFSMNAQHQLTESNHAPAAGDMYEMYQCDSLGIDPGPAGAGAVWNFSAITTHSSVVMSYTAATNSNPAYPSSSVAVAASANNTSYYSSNTSSLWYYGGNITAGAISGQLTYASPAIEAAYPMSIGTSTSASTAGSVNVILPPTTGTFTGSSHAIADASGTLILPGTNATFTNALRVVTSQTIDIVAGFTNATITQVVYNYYAADIKASLFSITTLTAQTGFGTTTQTLVTRNKNATVPTVPTTTSSIPTNAGIEDFTVYPNPASSVVTFSGNNKEVSHILVFDLTGKKVEELYTLNGTAKLDVSNYKKGVYLYRVTNSAGHTYKTGRITVTE